MKICATTNAAGSKLLLYYANASETLISSIKTGQLTDASSTKIDGSFFSVAITTPFETTQTTLSN
jgi:hypothetical protein